jgi:hypothetical protein
MAFEFFLAALQRRLIGLDCVETATDFRRFLCCHPAMLVKFDRIVSHGRLPFPASAVLISRIRRNRGASQRCNESAPPLHSAPPGAVVGRWQSLDSLQKLRNSVTLHE